MSVPKDPAEKVLVSAPDLGLTPGPFLVKVDRYGSVSALVRVRVPLGMLVICDEGAPYGRSGSPWSGDHS